MYSCYILKCKDGSYYIGSTRDVGVRVKRHNAGGSKYTKTKRPVELVYHESYNTRSEAVLREQQMKSWKNKKYIDKLISHNGPIV